MCCLTARLLVAACCLPAALLQAQDTPISLFSQVKARSIGPAVMSGRITDIEAVEDNPRILYVGTAGGGIWKSVNGGVTFSPVFDAYCSSIGCVTIDQKRSDTVWAGTGEGNVRNSVSVGTGLYRSRDGGRNWECLGFEDAERIVEIVLHPTLENTAFVAVLGHLWDDHETRGVYRTDDGGRTWRKILYVDRRTGCADLAIDPVDPDILYAAMWEFRRRPDFFTSGGPGSGLYQSRDGGRSWDRLQTGLPQGHLGRIAVEIAPSRPETVYALVEAKDTALYRSIDRGKSWERRNDSIAVRIRPFYFSNLEVDPRNPDRIYTAGLYLFTSGDGGKSFGAPLMTAVGSIHSDIHPIWIDPADPRHLFVGTDGGVYESRDEAKNYRLLGALPVSQFYHVAVDMQSPYHVYGGLQDNGSWTGPSAVIGGPIRNRDWRNLGSGDGFYVLPHPGDHQIVYYSWQGGNLMRLDRRQAEVKTIKPQPDPAQPKFRFNWNAAVSLSRWHSDTIYIGGQFLFRSPDRGDSWEIISPDLTSNDPDKLRQEESGGLSRENTTAENHCTIVTISESPLVDGEIWAGTDDGRLQVTRNGGRTWKNTADAIPGLPKSTWCSGVEAGRHRSGTVYAVFDGHRTGDMRTHVFRSVDSGATWTSLTSPILRGYAHVVREDPLKPGLLYLGTEFGLYISIDDGRNWESLKAALPSVAVTDLVVHPRDHDLVIATHGRGIFIIDDLTPLRALDRDLLARDAAMLPSRPSLIRLPISYQEFAGDAEFQGENPAGGAYISYYLKKRHIVGDLKLEILDADGKLIKTLPTGKAAGVNRVHWNMRFRVPKTASARGLGPMVLEGPNVPEGTYTLRLRKGSETISGALRLGYDPGTPHTPEDRRIRYQALMQSYRMIEDLGYSEEILRSLSGQGRRMLADWGGRNEETRRLLALFLEKAETLRQSVVQDDGLMKGEKLREALNSLYTALSMYLGRPGAHQLSLLERLDKEMKNFSAACDRLLQELPRVNDRLKTEKTPMLAIRTRSEYFREE